MKSKIHLIRHGLTEGNLKSWYYGKTDLPLVKEGIDGIRKYKKDGIYPTISGGYFTSGMLRTNQTLSEIYGDVERKHIDELQEINFGILECKTYDEIKGLEEYNRWTYDKTGKIKIPKGDSKNSFRNRVELGLQKLIDEHRIYELAFRHQEKEAESICVCHGGVIACIMAITFSNSDEMSFFKWIPQQARGYTLHLQDGKIIDFEVI